MFKEVIKIGFLVEIEGFVLIEEFTIVSIIEKVIVNSFSGYYVGYYSIIILD